MAKTPETAPLSMTEKIGYGVGDMASNFYMGVINVFLLYYYTDVWGISPASAAFMFLITKVIDAVSDPCMGLIADRTRSRWGRYRPYLLWGAVPTGFLGYLLFLGPDLSPTGKLIFAYVSYSLVMLAYTAINVPYSALLAVISPSAEERTKATQFRFIFASLGTLLVGATTKPLVDYLGNGDEVMGFRLTMVLFAVISVALFWFTFASTKERIQPAKQETRVSDEFGVLLKNISWIVLAVAGIFAVIGLVGRISSAAFYGKYYLKFDHHLPPDIENVIAGWGALGTIDVTDLYDKMLWWMDGTTLIITCGFLGQLIGALITPTLLNFFEKRTLMIVSNFGCAGSILATYLLGPDQYVPTLIFYTVGIFAFGIIITLLFAMYTDCADYGEWKSGQNSAGLTVSASMFSLKAGSAIGSAVPASLLALFGFVKGESYMRAVQTEEALFGIQLMFNVVPAVFFFLAGLLMLGYRIDSTLLKQIETDLQERRDQANS